MKSVACVGILVADVIVKSVKEYPEKNSIRKSCRDFGGSFLDI